MAGWVDLTGELDRWAAAGGVADFWWRDDDVVAPTPALDRLLRCADGVPLALAAVPCDVEEDLAGRLEGEPGIAVFQHGWRHRDHARGAGCSEYPAGRLKALVLQEFCHGRIQLESLFGARALPVFVPPWHGFDAGYMPLLHEAGIVGFSAKGARTRANVQALECVNIHCAPIEWTGTPSFGEDGTYLAQICEHLKGRRLGLFDFREPTGILTHHLVQDDRSYRFLARLSECIQSHPAARWLAIDAVFPRAGARAHRVAANGPAFDTVDALSRFSA